MLDDPTLAATSASVSTPGAKDSLRLRRGESAGRFVVIDELGRGAMGTVYAVFDTKLERQVALKLLNRSDRGMGSLLAEAQALARLNHNNVVTVYDVGEHQGRLYLAMELVRGKTLRAWTNDVAPDWRVVVEAFRKAARGLHAVHAADLVHGDFKPDNVMVAEDGRVLVMDFGIARTLEQTLSGEELTASHSGSRSIEVSRIRGTPAYMAPEQFRLDGVGPASDQFAFCIALHEALWGERPFGGDTLAELSCNVAEDRRRPRPSNRSVPRWVAQIVDRGLSKNPEDRFPSMLALDDAFDVRQQRRRWVWAGMVFVGSAAGLGTMFGEGEAPCVPEREALEELWNSGRRETIAEAFEETGHRRASNVWADAERTLDEFATEWLEASDALCGAEGLSQPEPVRTARRDCLTTQRVHLRAALDELTQPTTATVSRAGELSRSLPPPSACADPQSGLDATDPQLRQRVMSARGHLAEAEAAWIAGNLARAQDRVETGLGAIDEDEAPRIAAALYQQRGKLRSARGEVAARTDDIRRALTLASRGKDDRTIAELWVHLAQAAIADGHLDAAPHLVHAADMAIEEAQRPTDLEARHQRTLAVLAWKQGRYDEGLAAIQEGLGLARQANLESLQLAEYHNVRALLQLSASRYAEAEAAFTDAIALISRDYGPDHPRALLLRGNLATLHLEAGDRSSAVAAWEELRETIDATGVRGDQWAKATSALADTKRELGQLEEASELIKEALEAWRALDDGGRGELSALRVAAKIYSDLRRHDEAVDTARAAVDLAASTRSADDPYAVSTRLVLGRTLLARGDASEALEAFAAVRAFREENFGPDDPRTTSARRFELRALVELDAEDALKLVERIEIQHDLHPEATTPSNHLSVALAHARALEAVERGPQARAIARRTLSRFAARRDDAPAEYRDLATWAAERDALPLTPSG